ncbi:MAG TPA: DUF4278 domain-containing protein [Synechococcales cyanobacterium M55_K2018_004]|nr:DUF4278 domain-containing protein [Synechococcales cyanobacterium M55_K2018_004]
MELHYRGAAYETPVNQVEVIEGEVIGQYRGAALKRHEFRNIPAQPHPRMKYRGAWVK